MFPIDKSGRSTLIVAVLVVGLVGCDSKRSPPAPSAATPPGATAGATPNAPSTKPSSEALPPTSGAPATPDPVLEAERAAVGRLLAANGSGGWRIDENAATEMEGLSIPIDHLLLLMHRDEKLEVRRGAAHLLLARFEPRSNEQVAAFTAMLDDPDSTLRGFGVAAVRQMQRGDQIASLSSLADLLAPHREPRPESRSSIARLLGSFKIDAAPAAQPLQQCATGDPDATVRSAALVALAQVASAAEAAKSLGAALGDKDPAVRLVAATRLRQLGPGAAPAVQELAAALADADSAIAEAAAAALIRCGEPAVAPLIRQLHGENVEARKLALACLARLGPQAKVARSAIEKCKDDPDPIVRQLAEAASQRVGTP